MFQRCLAIGPTSQSWSADRWCCSHLNVVSGALKFCLQENESLVLEMGRMDRSSLARTASFVQHRRSPCHITSTPKRLKGSRPSLVSLPDPGNQEITSLTFKDPQSPRNMLGLCTLLFESGNQKEGWRTVVAYIDSLCSRPLFNSSFRQDCEPNIMVGFNYTSFP